MRNIAACAVVEDMFAWMLGSPKYAWRLDPAKNAEQFFYIVRELMDKPAKRRDPSVVKHGSEMDILGNIEGWKSKFPPKPRPQIVGFWRTNLSEHRITSSHAIP